jgi:hypothetical protein
MSGAWPPNVLALERWWRLPARAPSSAAPPPPGYSLASERRRLLLERRCFVCRGEIAPGAGCWFGHLGILLHGERGYPCHSIACGELRDYARSPQGRWRSKADVLRRLAARWPAPDGGPS